MLLSIGDDENERPLQRPTISDDFMVIKEEDGVTPSTVGPSERTIRRAYRPDGAERMQHQENLPGSDTGDDSPNLAEIAGFPYSSQELTDEDFEFSPERPFRRRLYHYSLREALVGGKKETNLLPQQEFIVIEDDEETEVDLRKPQATSVKADTAKAGTEAEKEVKRDSSLSMPEDRGKKRPIVALERGDEVEA
ncbi:uncharacterized protein FTJAE_6991 [Fusarium tjaetaba]|uniref:Uncharacterized protein n=1 Tax=Fusarium tjaetaba TaxID=1567544 RepID=A0A8H5RIU2_9HYPO|nr:uncharacterized protein FTJAE_6991 [Fusarium tjaetaba]KAF5633840.1 hypothetical protein FTJAE_6991 [Fusarium tjaetaba]